MCHVEKQDTRAHQTAPASREGEPAPHDSRKADNLIGNHDGAQTYITPEAFLAPLMFRTDLKTNC